MKYQTIKLAIPNGCGLKLATEIYKPEKDGRLPAVMLFHGFTGYKETADFVDIADKLARKGIVSIRFTASGFGDSEGTLEQDYRFSNHRKDAEAVYEYVRKLPYVDTSRLGVHGHSMGGKLAVLFARDHQNVKVLVVVSAPVTMTATSYGSHLEEWKSTGYFRKVSGRDGKELHVPYAYFVDVEGPENDVLIAAAQVTHPQSLVMAGDADTEVPWQETHKIYEALTCRKIWKLVKGIPHIYGKYLESRNTVNTLIMDFCMTNL